MLIETPANGTFGAAVLAGTLKTTGPATETTRYGVVMKAAYDLVPDGSNPRVMVQAQDENRAAIVFADEGVMTFTSTAPPIDTEVTPEDFSMKPWPTPSDEEKQVLSVAGLEFEVGEIEDNASQTLGFNLSYEAEVALRKQRIDIAVLGFSTEDGAVEVNGGRWLTRDLSLGDADSDTGDNLFGFEPRESFDRLDDEDDTAAFANFYRRSPAFPGANNAGPLPSGALVEIYRDNVAAGDPDYAFVLPELTYAARLRVYCGHGPDLAHHWRILPLADPRPDTLIVYPEEHKAFIVWRIDWGPDIAPPADWRQVQITQGDF